MLHLSDKRLFCAIAPLLLLSCHSNKEKGGKDNAPQGYAVLTLQPRPATTYRDFPATVQGQQVVEIRPMVDGYLEEIHVPEGATVTKGQLLFKISNPQYEQAAITARAAIKIAEADVNAAKMDVEKVRPLVQKDIVSKYELQSAQYTLQSKEAALAQAQATLANAQTNIGYTFIRSPQSGVIGLIPYKIGALVNSTTTNPLTTLSNTGNVFAYFSLNEKQLLGLSAHIPGNTIDEKLQRLPPVELLLADGSPYGEKGRLESASGLITTTTGTATFKATFPNPQGLIRSGASATVRIPRQDDTALLIPQSATYELQNKVFVYKLTTEGKVLSTAVESAPTGDGQFLIVRSGLVRGDRIVLNGFNLKDGTAVKPLPVNTDSLYQVHDTASQ
ncbi:efflux RND transporter periplasmic adaptor subunit [Taibaiella koreensis]|uniref:efflux RND transporter periplasmic adaptor subunit n=1 Tax=Taibaiella koreensis TaxID=1268548 RepID=UPI000E59CF8E|nr:efflux RND transporter periplasmic adaptor subunit [Taibaiella koreensis]